MRAILITSLKWLPAVAWAGVVFRLSSLQSGDLPSAPGWIGHLGIYTILGALVYAPMSRDMSVRRRMVVTILICSLYGVTDEFHQSFVPTRVPDVFDWIVDTVGATLGGMTAHTLSPHLRRTAERVLGAGIPSEDVSRD